jgi:hypothetical protein
MEDKITSIAAEAISYADGSFHLDYPDEYHELSLEDQQKVEELVFEEVGSCEICGWNWTYNNMEQHEHHGWLCCHCESNLEDEEDESDED